MDKRITPLPERMEPSQETPIRQTFSGWPTNHWLKPDILPA